MTGLSINISILIVDSVDREESTTLTLRDQQSDLYKQLITDDHDGKQVIYCMVMIHCQYPRKLPWNWCIWNSWSDIEYIYFIYNLL